MTTIIQTYSENTDNLTTGDKMHIRFSTDYGATWTADDTYTDSAPVTGFPLLDMDQAVVIQAPNGDILLLSNYLGAPGMYRSTDGGKTWGGGEAITFIGMAEADSLKTFPQDQGFVYDGVIYVSCIHFTESWGNDYDVLVKSTDSGVTWHYVGKISGETLTGEAGIEYIGNNTIISIVRPVSGYPQITHSFDMGVTWDACVPLSGFGYGGRFHLWTRAHLKGQANWWTDPVLIMCGFTYIVGTGRYNTFWVSMDSGTTWIPGLFLDAPSEMGGYGDVFYDADNDQYVVVMYHGSNFVADIKQYNLTIGGI